MVWEDICDDPTLRDLPFKIETNGRGQIVMSPARGRHGEYQGAITLLLARLLPQGRVIIECPIQTTSGVRVPDVAWASQERRQPVIYTLAPELCIEALSPVNDDAEMAEKRALYFAAGAEEVWLCAKTGEMQFFTREGEKETSLFCPEFPILVEL